MGVRHRGAAQILCSRCPYGQEKLQGGADVFHETVLQWSLISKLKEKVAQSPLARMKDENHCAAPNLSHDVVDV